MAVSKPQTPLQASFNFQFRPFLDAVDKLRSMHVMDEGIELPTIVVVGDQSSGKSSVLESLAGISLPHGEGIVTRVPLVLRMQKCSQDDEPEISIRYEGKKPFIIEEHEIQKEVNAATLFLAGDTKNIVNKEVELIIRKPDAPDLTMVDLPGITRVPVDGQPEDVYEQIRDIILKYISSERSIILNVLSATVDFSTCESIRMSRQVDELGKRTLAVVTKVDRSPEGLYDKVITNAVKVGLGYICVRNKTDNESCHEEARAKEKELFESNKYLSKMPKHIVGVGNLAKRLTYIQEESLKTTLPSIVKQINSNLVAKRKELEALPREVSDPAFEYYKLIRKVQRQLEELVNGRFVGVRDDKQMHYTARLHELFIQFHKELCSSYPEVTSQANLEAVTRFMSEAKGVSLPNFLPSCLFQQLIANKMEDVSELCLGIVASSHNYAENMVLDLVPRFVSGWPNLQALYNDKVLSSFSRSRSSCDEFVKHKLAKESKIVFTYNHLYMRLLEATRSKLKSSPPLVLNLANPKTPQAPPVAPSLAEVIEGIEFQHLSRIGDEQVVEMVVSFVAYWKVVLDRLSDEIALELSFSLEKALLEDLEAEMQQAGMQLDMKKMMSEDEEISMKRDALNHSVKTLQKCAAVVAGLSTPRTLFV